MKEKEFPMLARKLGKRRMVYLDNAATSQKPKQVIDAVSRFYRTSNANVHRGMSTVSYEATEAFEKARSSVARFINAHPDEIVFVRNATEAVNLVMYSWGTHALGLGDRIVTTELEHHSNFVPWQQLAALKKLKMEVIPISGNGLDRAAAERMLSKPCKLLAISHMSNVTGEILDVARLTALAHGQGARVLVDACQSAAHMPIDVRAIDCDFLVFSGHKLYGPSGIGILYAKRELLQTMQPMLFGGSMIKEVTLARSTFADAPQRFEAGTPNIEGAIGLAAAIAYVQGIGWRAIQRQESMLTAYARKRLSKVPSLTLHAPLHHHLAILSFTLGTLHPHDLAGFLDAYGIQVRAGYHCAEPLHRKLGLPGTARASIALYNTKKDIDALVSALTTIQRQAKKHGLC